jgi:hypothetical protein
MLGSKRGQALIELIPSVLLFLIVSSSSLAYFRVMRSSQIRQEVVRNLMFAKIDNSGPLVTSAQQTQEPLQLAGVEVGSRAPASAVGGNTVAMSANTDCLAVFPGDSLSRIPVTNILGLSGFESEVQVATYAVIFRRSGNSRCPN